MSEWIEYRRDNAAFDRWVNDPAEDVQRNLYKRASRLLTLARRQVGTKTGKLKRSLQINTRRDGRGQYVQVGSPLPIALLHHEGTRPHVIDPERARVMRFVARGRVVYAERIMHPGTRPNRYLTDNLRRVVND